MSDLTIELRPIGVVHSPVSDLHQMPLNGVPAQVEVFPKFRPGLLAIESNTHLIVLGWFHQAQRDRLQVGGKSPTSGQPVRGAFGLRASDRPNPIGLNVARLLSAEDGVLSFDRLDMIDGTPVVDLKRYSPGWDCVFSARTSRDIRPPQGDEGAFRDDLLLEAEHFHGELCEGARRAAELVLSVAREWGVSPKDPRLTVELAQDGCLADAVQAMCAATIGSGRLRIGDGKHVRFVLDGRQMAFPANVD